MKKVFVILSICISLLFVSSSFAGRFAEECPIEDRDWIKAGQEFDKAREELEQILKKLQKAQENLERKNLANFFANNKLLGCLEKKKGESREKK